MLKKIIYLLGIVLTIGVGMWLYSFLCCSCRDYCPNNTSQSAIMPPKSTFALSGKDFNYKCDGNFDFHLSSFKSEISDTSCINDAIDKLKATLMESPQKLTIAGYALPDEENSSIFENLGMARANDIKNYFVSRGIPEHLIEIRGEEKENLSQEDGMVYGPVAFSLSELPAEADKEDFDLLKEKINADPLVLYFGTGKNTVELTEQDRKKVSDIVRYLDNVPDATIKAIGYGDNVGSAAVNMKIGQQRADFIKSYFQQNGISSDRIISSSKGSDNPVASNNTEAGRAKNRRVEIKF